MYLLPRLHGQGINRGTSYLAWSSGHEEERPSIASPFLGVCAQLFGRDLWHDLYTWLAQKRRRNLLLQRLHGALDLLDASDVKQMSEQPSLMKYPEILMNALKLASRLYHVTTPGRTSRVVGHLPALERKNSWEFSIANDSRDDENNGIPLEQSPEWFSQVDRTQHTNYALVTSGTCFGQWHIEADLLISNPLAWLTISISQTTCSFQV
jgi:hypothetical protein